MRFVLTVLAILACLAAVFHHGNTKPLSKAERNTRLRALDDLIRYLARREEGEFPPSPSSENNEVPENEQNGDGQEGGDTSGQENQGNEGGKPVENIDGAENPENSGTVSNSIEGAQNNVNGNEQPDADNTADEETKRPDDIEKNLRDEFDGVKMTVKNLLDVIKDGLQNGKLNEVGDIVDFLVQFLEDLEGYNKNLQTSIQKTDEALDEIVSEMENAAKNLQSNDEGLENSAGSQEQKVSQANEGFVVEENESPAVTGGEEKTSEVADQEEKPSEVVGEDVKPSDGGSEKEKPVGNAGEEGKPSSGAGEGERPLGDGPGEDGSSRGSTEEGNPDNEVGNGNEEVRNTEAVKKSYRRERLLNNKELLLLLNKLQDLKA